MKYYSEDQVRSALKCRLNGKTQAELAKQIGVGQNFLSMVINGAPVTGKILSFLGFAKVRTRLYERAK